MRPLSGVKVVDFSALLPGPLASLMLAEAGAEVIKVERPGAGDESRLMSAPVFAMLNRGKRSLCADLKDEAQIARLRALIAGADILIEQFRPGVMDRAGLGWEAMRALNPRLIYCSITGYGQTGPKAAKAGHDLNYQAEAGMLFQVQALPPTLTADILGGAYPAVINILLALAQREKDGAGSHLDVAMSDNLYPAMFWDLAQGLAEARWPKAGRGLFTGGSPRYGLYETKDGRMLAVAALEDRFWSVFRALIDLPDPEASRDEVAARIKARESGHWRAVFADQDACCGLVESLEDALSDPHVESRDLFSRRVELEDGRVIPALPVAVASCFRSGERVVAAPALGEFGFAPGVGNV